MPTFRATSALILLAGCSSAPADLPVPITSGDGFFDRPWPDDARLVDGHLDLTGFPKRGEIGLVDRYIDLAETLTGFGTNAPLYLRLDREPDAALLPTADESVALGASLFLLNIDQDSPDYGQRTPITWTWDDVETDWKPAGLFAVQPVWGFPLDGATTYALVLTRDAFAPAPDFEAVWSEGSPDHARYAPLAELLPSAGLRADQVAFATVFTTQDPTGAMATIAQTIHDDLDTPALDQALVRWNSTLWFRAYEGTMLVPLWQHGTKPYLSEGGGFAFDEAGAPVMAEWETVKFTFTIPVTETEPEGGWPVVINAHGTGGDDRSHAEGDDRLSPAAVQAKRGMALFEISQPLHADRGTGADPTLVSFNYLNPEAARCTFRQGALDQVYLAEILTARRHCFTTDDDLTACTDPDRVAYMGHSQGGIVGSMAVPFFDRRVKAAVLSGAGGGLSVTLIERPTEEVDVKAILAEQLEFDDDEELTITHPLVGLVQVLTEVTDPLNYAPWWYRRSPNWDSAPVSVFMTEGLLDDYTPPPTTEALAAAAGVPFLEPVARDSDAAFLRGLSDQPLPASGNEPAYNGTQVTAGVMQYPDAGHFPIFDDPDAAKLYGDFLESAMQGAPILEQE